MTRDRFTADFDYTPTPQITVGYLAGMEETVKRACAAQAIAAGKAVRITPPAGNKDVPGDG